VKPSADFELLCRLVDNDLTAGEQSALSERLQAEPGLAAEFEQLRGIGAATAELLDVQPPPDLAEMIMAKVRVRRQVSAHPLRRLADWLIDHWPVPVAAAVACSLMLVVGLPEAGGVVHPGVARVAASVPATVTEQVAEVEIEEVDSEANYNVLVLSAPGSRNRVVWLTPRQSAEEEG
jgi:anti-sigma factor RsiW